MPTNVGITSCTTTMFFTMISEMGCGHSYYTILIIFKMQFMNYTTFVLDSIGLPPPLCASCEITKHLLEIANNEEHSEVFSERSRFLAFFYDD